VSRRYAERTEVPAERSKMEIEKILQRYGAKGFAYVADAGKSMIAFRANSRNIRFILPMPTIEEASKTEKGRARRECRGRWRSGEA
jgi:hypothetical protein